MSISLSGCQSFASLNDKDIEPALKDLLENVIHMKNILGFTIFREIYRNKGRSLIS